MPTSAALIGWPMVFLNHNAKNYVMEYLNDFVSYLAAIFFYIYSPSPAKIDNYF